MLQASGQDSSRKQRQRCTTHLTFSALAVDDFEGNISALLAAGLHSESLLMQILLQAHSQFNY